MYHNSQWSLLKVSIHRYWTSFKEYFNSDWYKITRDMRDLLVSTESFYSFLRHHPLIRYRSTALKFFFYRNWFVQIIS